jgi:hypothetical protein
MIRLAAGQALPGPAAHKGRGQHKNPRVVQYATNNWGRVFRCLGATVPTTAGHEPCSGYCEKLLAHRVKASSDTVGFALAAFLAFASFLKACPFLPVFILKALRAWQAMLCYAGWRVPQHSESGRQRAAQFLWPVYR